MNTCYFIAYAVATALRRHCSAVIAKRSKIKALWARSLTDSTARRSSVRSTAAIIALFLPFFGFAYFDEYGNWVEDSSGTDSSTTSSYDDTNLINNYLYPMLTALNDLDGYISNMNSLLQNIDYNVANGSGSSTGGSSSSSSTDYSSMLQSIYDVLNNTLYTQIQSLSTSVEQSQQSIISSLSGLTTYSSAIENEILQVHTDLSTVMTTLQTIDSNLSSIPSIYSDVQLIYSYVYQMWNDLYACKQRLDSLDQTLTNFYSSFSSFYSAFGDYSSDIQSSLNDVISAINNMDVSIAGTINVENPTIDVINQTLQSLAVDFSAIKSEVESISGDTPYIRQDTYHISENLQNWLQKEWSYSGSFYDWNSTSFESNSLQPSIWFSQKTHETATASDFFSFVPKLFKIRTQQLDSINLTIAKLLQATLNSFGNDETNTVDTTSYSELPSVDGLDSSLSVSDLGNVSVNAWTASPAILQQFDSSLPDDITFSFSIDDESYSFTIDVNRYRSFFDSVRAFFTFVWWGCVLVVALYLFRLLVTLVSFVLKFLNGLNVS